jgi:AraC-like DNA-binding protein
MDSKWTFNVISECQRFICEATGTPWADVSALADRVVARLPAPTSPLGDVFLRTTLLQLAMRWGYERHQQVREHCLSASCAPLTLADAVRFWPAAQPSAFLFARHVKAIAHELASSHREKPALRAAAILSSAPHLSLDFPRLARQVGAHPTTLRRAFWREFGVSPHHFLMRIRVERAELLLGLDSDEKIDSVALQLGWASKTGLYRAFRLIRGCTPRQDQRMVAAVPR